MKLVATKLEMETVGKMSKLVIENVDAIARDLTVLDARLLLGNANIDVVALDGTGSLVLIAIDRTSDEQLLLKAVEAYSWCLEYPEAVRRLYPAADVSVARPPRVMFVVERMSDSFHRKVKQLGFPEVDCVEFRHLAIDGAEAVHFDTIVRLRRATLATEDSRPAATAPAVTPATAPAPAPDHGTTETSTAARATSVKLQKLLAADTPAPSAAQKAERSIVERPAAPLAATPSLPAREPGVVVSMMNRTGRHAAARLEEAALAPMPALTPAARPPVMPPITRRPLREPEPTVGTITLEPAAVVAPVAEVMVKPEPVTPVLELVMETKPIEASAPMVTAGPVIAPVVEPAPIVTPEPVAVAPDIDLVVEPAPVVTPEPAAAAAPVIVPELIVVPEPIVAVAPVIEPQPVAVPEPVIAAAAVIEPIVVPEPIVAVAAVIEPEPVVVPEPVVTIAAAIEPIVVPEPIVAVAPITEPEPIVVPEPVVTIAAAIEPIVEPEPEVEPVVAALTEPEPVVEVAPAAPEPPRISFADLSRELLAAQPVERKTATVLKPVTPTRPLEPPASIRPAATAGGERISLADLSKELLGAPARIAPAKSPTPKRLDVPPVEAPRAEEVTRAIVEQIDSVQVEPAVPVLDMAPALVTAEPLTVAALAEATAQAAPPPAAAPEPQIPGLPQEFEGLKFPGDGVLTRQWMDFLSQMTATK